MSILLALALFGADPIHVPEAEAVRQMHAATACIVRERSGEARALLAMDFRTVAYRERIQQLARHSRDCFRRWMGMSGLAFAGGLAEQLYLDAHGSADPTDLVSNGTPVPRNRSEAMSFCIVERAPGPARAVLDAPPTSAEEAAALDGLRPAIASCLDSGEEAQLNRPGLRSLLALALHNIAERR